MLTPTGVWLFCSDGGHGIYHQVQLPLPLAAGEVTKVRAAETLRHCLFNLLAFPRVGWACPHRWTFKQCPGSTAFWVLEIGDATVLLPLGGAGLLASAPLAATPAPRAG